MISRREKLLIRPWEQRRYENHRRKVCSALPAIDVGPPPNRLHVICKLKKQQKESERCDKIEKDNLKLLQRMRRIMSTSRVDNTWKTSQPSFLNRVEVYSTKSKSKYSSKSCSVTPEIEKKSRKEKCHACTPQKIRQPTIPEERMPWDPPKTEIFHKRSQSLPSKNIETAEPPQGEKSKVVTPKEVKTSPPRSKSSRFRSKKASIGSSTQSIVLSRGDLHLAVNFPADTLVKLKDGQSEKFIIRGNCQCRAINAY